MRFFSTWKRMLPGKIPVCTCICNSGLQPITHQAGLQREVTHACSRPELLISRYTSKTQPQEAAVRAEHALDTVWITIWPARKFKEIGPNLWNKTDPTLQRRHGLHSVLSKALSLGWKSPICFRWRGSTIEARFEGRTTQDDLQRQNHVFEVTLPFARDGHRGLPSCIVLFHAQTQRWRLPYHIMSVSQIAGTRMARALNCWQLLPPPTCWL